MFSIPTLFKSPVSKSTECSNDDWARLLQTTRRAFLPSFLHPSSINIRAPIPPTYPRAHTKLYTSGASEYHEIYRWQLEGMAPRLRKAFWWSSSKLKGCRHKIDHNTEASTRRTRAIEVDILYRNIMRVRHEKNIKDDTLLGGADGIWFMAYIHIHLRADGDNTRYMKDMR